MPGPLPAARPGIGATDPVPAGQCVQQWHLSAARETAKKSDWQPVMSRARHGGDRDSYW